ncbi:MAG: hypothetical protein ACRDPA_17275 [Solirubrobacteraceae bacterium]
MAAVTALTRRRACGTAGAANATELADSGVEAISPTYLDEAHR